MQAAAEFVVGDTRDTVAAARRFVRDALVDLVPSSLVDDAMLVTSELVTNAVLHGRAPRRVRVRSSPGRVRLEVEDGGAGVPVLPVRSDDAMTGRGLHLVAALSSAWGVEPGESSKTVWAELSAEEQAEQPAAPDMDLDALLAAFPDRPDAEPTFTIRLGAVPTDLLLAAKRHLDNVVREAMLARSATSGRVPSPLDPLISTVTGDFASARAEIKRQALAAAARGDAETELVLVQPLSAADAGQRYLEALDQVDVIARDALTLTLEPPYVHKVFRRWYVQSLVDQLRARASGVEVEPPPTFVQALAQELAAAAERHQAAGRIDYQRLFRSIPTAYLVMSPDLVIVEVNDAYCSTVGRSREELVGQPVFTAFPPTADALDETGVSWVQRSFEKARDTGRPDTMPIQKYDIPDPATGAMLERFWSLISIPILDDQGRTILVVQRTEDITDYLRARKTADADRDQNELWRRRAADAEADLFARARELEAARRAQAEADRRFVALADVALHLAGAQTLAELVAIVVDRGMKALGADGGAVAVRRPGSDILDVALTEGLGEQARATYSTLPVFGPMPTSQAALGRRVLLPDVEATLAWHPDMGDVIEWTGCVAWAALPLHTTDGPVGALTIGWRTPQQFSPAELEVLEAMAAQCANALERVTAREAERAAAAAAVSMSEALQRSLLSEPPQPDDVEIVVRYRPASEQAQVGGDWHDAFVTSGGVTSLTIGDVAGHDRTAAAAMGQVRNLLRGIGYAVNDSPATLLSTLDRSLADLDVATLATAVLAQIHQNDSDRESGTRRLRWSNAGHPPPLLIGSDGRAQVLHTTADLLLGLDPDTTRTDHEVALPAGSTVLLYTDGLVERRGTHIDEGVAWLAETVSGLADLSLDALCDALLAGIPANEDDIALLALRARQ